MINCYDKSKYIDKKDHKTSKSILFYLLFYYRHEHRHCLFNLIVHLIMVMVRTIDLISRVYRMHQFTGSPRKQNKKVKMYI